MRTLALAVLATLSSIATVATVQPPNGGRQAPAAVADELPPVATAKLVDSLAAARAHASHVWRDTPGTNTDGTVNAYIEIARGDDRKWELDIGANARKVDRVMPPEVGGFPINYGFVPQSISYDGDPFDALVTGPPIAGGTLVKGIIIGLMRMTDEKGQDSKVVLSPVDAAGRPAFRLTEADREHVADFFRRYKRYDPKTFSTVPGWGNESDGRAHVDLTQAFFRQCRDRAGRPCRVTVR